MSSGRPARVVAAAAAAVALVTGCTPADPGDGEAADGGAIDCSSTAAARFPDVVAATLEATDDGTYRVSATVCSAYDTPERYADAWRVVGPDGAVLGVRELLHDHAGEQPFRRSLAGVAIPDGVDRVVVEGRDLANGWGGGTVEVTVP